MNWMKYTFVCDPDNCDALLEFTARDGFDFPSGVVQITCPCGRQMQYVSATIQPTTTERETMLTDNVITYGDTERIQAQELTIQALESDKKRYFDMFNNAQSKINRIIDNLTQDNFYDRGTTKEEVLEELCEILDHEPKQTVRITATVEVVVEYDIPMNEVEDFDASYFLQDELSIDANNGDIVIDSFDVQHVDVEWE